MINVPKTHWGVRAELLDGLPHEEATTNYLKSLKRRTESGDSLVLCGEYSRGKSAIAALLLREALGLGIIGYWLPMRNWAKVQIEKTLFDASYNITVEEHCLECPLLVVDEFVLRDNIAYNEQAMEHLIRQRADEDHSTIITTNLSWRTLESEYPAISAAMVGVYKWIEVRGYDFRADPEGLLS